MKLHKPDGYKDLLVYKRAAELRLYVQKLTEKLSYDEKRRIVHLNDSARSVKQNVVEGWKRSTTQQYYEFLSFSIGSLAEIKEDIKDLFDDQKIKKVTHDFFTEKCNELDYLLNRLRQSLYAKMQREGTLPMKEKYQNLKNTRQSEDEFLNKLTKEAGLKRLENGQYVPE